MPTLGIYSVKILLIQKLILILPWESIPLNKFISDPGKHTKTHMHTYLHALHAYLHALHALKLKSFLSMDIQAKGLQFSLRKHSYASIIHHMQTVVL